MEPWGTYEVTNVEGCLKAAGVASSAVACVLAQAGYVAAETL